MSDITMLLEQGATARREDRIADARAAYAEARRRARVGDDPAILIRAVRGAGNVERDDGNADEAVALYRESVALARRHGDPRLLAHALRHLGELELELGRPVAAADPLAEALALVRRDPDATPLETANTLRPMALLRGTESLQLWQEACDLYAAAGVDAGVAECRYRIQRLATGPARVQRGD